MPDINLRGWARAIIPGLARTGLGSNAIIRQLRNLAEGEFGQRTLYRKKEMLRDIRSVTGLIKNEAAFTQYDAYADVPKYLMMDVRLRQDERYLIHGKVNIMNNITGEIESRHVSFYSDILKSKAQWASDFTDYYPAYEYDDTEELMDVEIIGAEHNEGWSW
jgi:hypothetical protein